MDQKRERETAKKENWQINKTISKLRHEAKKGWIEKQNFSANSKISSRDQWKADSRLQEEPYRHHKWTHFVKREHTGRALLQWRLRPHLWLWGQTITPSTKNKVHHYDPRFIYAEDAAAIFAFRNDAASAAKRIHHHFWCVRLTVHTWSRGNPINSETQCYSSCAAPKAQTLTTSATKNAQSTSNLKKNPFNKRIPSPGLIHLPNQQDDFEINIRINAARGVSTNTNGGFSQTKPPQRRKNSPTWRPSHIRCQLWRRRLIYMRAKPSPSRDLLSRLPQNNPRTVKIQGTLPIRPENKRPIRVNQL